MVYNLFHAHVVWPNVECRHVEHYFKNLNGFDFSVCPINFYISLSTLSLYIYLLIGCAKF